MPRPTRSPSRLYRVAWAFYLVLASGGLVGLAAQGRRLEWRLLVDPASWWIDLVLGVVSGLGLLGLWVAARRALAPARRLEETLARLLGPLSGAEVLSLALISAVAEEIAFRGALQHAAGWLPAAAVFALLHLGPGAPFRTWSLFALAGGLAFGGIVAWREALAGPILGHLLVNLVQLRRLAELRGDDTAGMLPDD
jgi:membrane protease YdiL (CAAX protease family)